MVSVEIQFFLFFRVNFPTSFSVVSFIAVTKFSYFVWMALSCLC